MLVHLKELIYQFKKKIENINEVKALEKIRIEYLGKKGHITLYMNRLKTLPLEQRPAIGIILNDVKQQILLAFNQKKQHLEIESINNIILDNKNPIDISLPGRGIKTGGIHPITSIIDRIEKIFYGLGFELATGPEIEDCYHNFDALNISLHHPARTEHDTFWFNDTYLLRTQMSGVQIRIMKTQKPPIKIIASGKVYRKDNDKTHTPMFHQTEGLIVDQDISFSHLKTILCNFLKIFFDKPNLKIRFRPSYFPFTEPSAEIDIISKEKKWIEVLGCGMVHPNVLNKVGISADTYSGLAFGMGIERLAMLYYEISDLRQFYENDLRFLKQFN
ncbi:MAG: phenylalanine--tRNA ligase subunit alpha [Candidatus Dasytiphilus stammeri]